MNATLPLGGLGAALLFSSLGCGSAALDPASEAGKLEFARAKWSVAATRSYQFTLFRSAFIAPGYSGPARITVTNGVVVKVESAGSQELAPGAFDSCDTVEELFALAQGGIETDGAIVDGTYDPETGVPKTLSIDPIPRAADDEVTYIITDFTAL